MNDDLEQRLRAWGQDEVRRAGSPPQLAPPTPRRPWLAAAVATATVLAAAGVLLTRSGPSTPAAPASDVVPWADLLPAPDSGRPTLPPPTADPSVRLCRAADLAATQDWGQGAGGSVITSFRLTNVAPTPCRLTGRLEGLSGIHQGARRSIHVTQWQGESGWTVPVVLAPHASGELPYSYYPRCDAGPARRNAYSSLRLALLGGVVEVRGAVLDLGCSTATVGIQAQPAGGQAPEPRYAPDPRTDLTVSLQAPQSVAAGATLRYLVTLTNPTAAPIALEPCPNFLQALSGLAKELHQLNCPAAHPVPAAGSEQFAMELRVPAGAPDGPATLAWGLALPSTGKPPYVLVTITGGVDAQQAQLCGPTATGPPCGAGMVLGQRYAYVLYTHCGLRGLRADGRDWVFTGKDISRPADIADPEDVGTVVLDAPELLTYSSSGGEGLTFQPRVATDPTYPPCD